MTYKFILVYMKYCVVIYTYIYIYIYIYNGFSPHGNGQADVCFLMLMGLVVGYSLQGGCSGRGGAVDGG